MRSITQTQLWHCSALKNIFPCSSLSLPLCFGYFCTFVLHVCLCVEKLFFCLAFSLCLCVVPSRDCTHASCPAPASSQCYTHSNALRKKWPGECVFIPVAHGRALLIITHVFVAVLNKRKVRRDVRECAIFAKCQV